MSTEVRVGLVVNPIAGMGGRVGLKGTDGEDAVDRAVALGAVPVSSDRARIALDALNTQFREKLTLLTPPGSMGEHVAREAGINPEVIGKLSAGATTPNDTISAAREIEAAGVDLLLFAGGDGTARNIFEAVGSGCPVLGIPTGVKMHSSVYATTPQSAGELAAVFLASSDKISRESEVMDIDEEAFREGRVSARLYGYLNVPFQRNLVQGLKSGSGASDAHDFAGIAADIAERMQDGMLWILGPGTTTRAIATYLDQPKTLLGVDLFSGHQLIASDLSERGILSRMQDRAAHIVVTPIGGQGYIFGRGNQQLSPAVIRQVDIANIIIVATSGKLAGLEGRPLLVDTGDTDLDNELRGYRRVVTNYHQETVQKVS